MRQLVKRRSHTLIVVFLDVLMITLAGMLALLVRFDFSFPMIPSDRMDSWVKFLPLQIGVTILVFGFRKMYGYIWHNVSASDVAEMFFSVTAAYALSVMLMYLLDANQPRSVIFIAYLLELILLIGFRCFFRFWRIFEQRMSNKEGEAERIMLIGAGQAGSILAREIENERHLNAKLICFIDDNPVKWGKYLEGVPIIGGRDKICEAASRYDIHRIIFAIPKLEGEERQKLLEICNSTNCRVQTLPGIYQLVNGEVSISSVKDVNIEDLLGRDSVRLDNENLEPFLKGKTILVTGGGGSIGSELCRQIAHYHPKKLIVLDIYENSVYEIQQALHREYGAALDVEIVIASIRDKERIYSIFERYHPQIVFHAAAHKHVPLMEICPSEAIKNNIFGTYHVVRAAEKFGTQKFVMISTDKAVNPTNFMGATKRFCEMILESRPEGNTVFCAVRFGNVLGSNGSVVPLFQEQIRAGGPVTITDKRIIRYFMTIAEAAQLVLQAGAMAERNQMFVLDMGKPVKILDLAENLIRLSGHKPYQDIDIQEIGLRPGEKLYEELLMKSEHLTKTANKKIFIEQQPPLDAQRIMDDLLTLDRAVTEDMDNEELIGMLRAMIPTYHDPDEVNQSAIEQMKQEETDLMFV